MHEPFRHSGQEESAIQARLRRTAPPCSPSLLYCPGWAEIPLLTNNFLEGAPAIRRPSQGELLRALDFSFLENQPDTFQLLRLVEQEADDLGSGLGSPPAPSLSWLQRKLDRTGFVFRCNLDHPQVGHVESTRSVRAY